MQNKIGILTHAQQGFQTVPYLLHTLLPFWQKKGVTFVHFQGIGKFEPADALFLHVDTTVIPEKYLAFSKQFPIVVNGSVRDISKRRISSQTLCRTDNFKGKVIVKTNQNCGGGPERSLARRKYLPRKIHRLKKHLPWSWSGYLPPDDYPIFDSPGEVPRAAWWNPKLVVEKFLPERVGDNYCLRQWVFLGDREMSQRIISSEPIVKAANVLHREIDIPIPASLRHARAAMGFDYGKFDFVMVDDKAVLLDANKTPSFNNKTTSSRMALFENLSEGLSSILENHHLG
jgi:hypothetical protein